MKNAMNGKPEEDELARAQELLARTVRFLSHCTIDPGSACQSEDPRELIRGLESLSIGPVEDQVIESLPEPRTIQIRHRKSA